MVTDNYKVEVYISSQWIENEIDIRSLSINEVLYKKLKPADSSASFSFVPNQTLYNQLKTTSGDIPVRIKKNDVIIFTGYIRRNFDINKTQKLESLKIEVVSPSFLLKRKIGQNIEYKSKTVTYIVNDLLTKAGLSLFTLPTISAVIPGLYIESGKETYHSIIERMLWEYGFTFGFDRVGTFVTYKLKPDSLTTSKLFDGSNCLNRINQKAEEEEIKHVIVDWIATKTLTNPIVFSDTTNAQNGYKCYIELPPNSYLNSEQYWLAQLDMPEGEILSAEGLSLDIINDADIQVLTFEPVGNKVRLSIKNTNTSVSKFIKKLDIRATSAVVKLEGANKSIVIKELGTEKIEEVESKYIYEKQYGDALANLLGWYYNYSDYKYKISSKTNYDLNDIVTIADQNIGTNKARIVEKKTNHFNDVIDYTLEAIDEYTPSTVENELVYSPPTPTGVVDSIQTLVEAGLNSDGTISQPINSNTMIADITPTGDGLYLTKSYIGLRNNNDWSSFIKSDGTFSFKGDTDNYVTWDNSKLKIKGDLFLSGNSTITGKISTGSLQSNTYSAGSSGFILNSDGSAEFNSVTVRGVVHASSGSFSGDVTTANILASGGTIGGMALTTTELKSSNYVSGSTGFLINNSGFAEFNNINVRGNVNSTSGSIGGWNITSDKLVSSITGARVELNQALNRVAIYNTSGIEKVVMGYLSGLIKNSGSGTYGTSDYGFWVAPGDTVVVDGAMKLLNGDMTASDSVFKVLTSGTEVARLGSYSGTVGLHLWNGTYKQTLTANTTSIRLRTPSGYLDLGPQNLSWCHFATDRSAFYFDKNVASAGGFTVYGLNAGLDSAGNLRAIAKTASTYSNSVYVKDEFGYFSERTIPGVAWTNTQAINTTSSPTFKKLNLVGDGTSEQINLSCPGGTGTQSLNITLNDSNLFDFTPLSNDAQYRFFLTTSAASSDYVMVNRSGSNGPRIQLKNTLNDIFTISTTVNSNKTASYVTAEGDYGLTITARTKTSAVTSFPSAGIVLNAYAYGGYLLTSGNILSVKNYNQTKLSVDYAGNVVVTGAIKPNGSSYTARGTNISSAAPTSSDGVNGDIWIVI